MKTQLSIINLVNAYSTGCGERITQSSVGRSISSSIMMAQCVLSVVDGDMIKAWDRPSLKNILHSNRVWKFISNKHTTLKLILEVFQISTPLCILLKYKNDVQIIFIDTWLTHLLLL